MKPAYATRTPLYFFENSIIVAATSPTLSKAAPSDDGWFISDFYAFNYLLRGRVEDQTWLSHVSPKDILSKYPSEPGYLHGNPYETRKVVLSHDLLARNELTPVSVVKNVTEAFRKTVAEKSLIAKRKGAPLVLLVFCHGADGQTLVLGPGGQKLTVQYLKGVLEPGVRTTLISTACFSGGWAIHEDLNMTTLAAANDESASNSWNRSNSLGRYCGSVFSTALVETLTGVTSPLLDLEQGGPSSDGSVQPPNPNSQQTLTFNLFCEEINNVCENKVTRLFGEQTFTFSAENDDWEFSWPGLTAIPLAYFERRWNQLEDWAYTGSPSFSNQNPNNPLWQEDTALQSQAGSRSSDAIVDRMTEAILKARAMEMAKIMLNECPDHWTQGWNTSVEGRLIKFVQGAPEALSPANMIAMIRFRWEYAQLADMIVHQLGLPLPNNEICILSDLYKWERERTPSLPDLKKKIGIVDKVLRKRKFVFEPLNEDDPLYFRPLFYVRAAIVETGKEDEVTLVKLAEKVGDLLDQAKAFYAMKALQKAPGLQKSGQTWARSIGRRIREVHLHKKKRSSVTSATFSAPKLG